MLIKKIAKKLAIVTFSFLTLMTASPTYAKDQVEVVNNVKMGNVSIALYSEQLDKETGKVIPWKENQIVLPGETISEIVRIQNEGEKAWVRAKVTFETKSFVNLSEDEVKFVEGWEKKKDGFWYWTKPLAEGENVRFIESVTIPEQWPSDKISKTKFNLSIQADAVQSTHFEPDFKSDDPWFGTLIETSLYNYTRKNEKTSLNFFIAYEGGAEGLIYKGDDFFSNWGTIMPGDSFEDKLVISNRYAQKIRMYFRSENDIQTDLEKQIKLKIYKGEENIYDGTLAGIKNEIVLADLKQGDEFVMTYKIEVPKELGNTYSLTEGHTKWIFRAEIINNENGGGKRTGVDNDPTKYLYGSAIALVAIAMGFWIIKKTNRKKA